VKPFKAKETARHQTHAHSVQAYTLPLFLWPILSRQATVESSWNFWSQ